MNTKKTFIMSEKSCPKYVPGLTNMPKKKKKCKPTSNNCASSAWDWSATIFNIKSKWSIGFEVLIQELSLFLGSLPSALSLSVMETSPRLIS